MKKSIYDSEGFFQLYQKMRSNPQSLNEVVEKPTMLSLLPNLSDKKLLDLGCGCGEHLQLYLQQQAKFVVGIDLSAEMLKQAKQDLHKFCGIKTKFALYEMPMEDLAQLPEQNFDVITSSFAFHYVENFTALLVDIYAKLKKGGELIFSQEHPIVTCFKNGKRWEKDQNKQFVAYRLNHYRDEGLRNRNWFEQTFVTYHRTLSTIINNLIETGFKIEKLVEPMLVDDEKWQSEFKDLQHRPVLLFIKAKKI
ncbi:class I SAM-dependent DNA methyltransferase [Seminibacterium arietis]|uniref:Class I SAM-dependent DNA methyltransferase n=1 Tax=Seminibacterium arietis TaxID=1173502 RepID=A0ABW3IA74_9PAST